MIAGFQSCLLLKMRLSIVLECKDLLLNQISIFLHTYTMAVMKLTNVNVCEGSANFGTNLKVPADIWVFSNRSKFIVILVWSTFVICKGSQSFEKTNFTVESTAKMMNIKTTNCRRDDIIENMSVPQST